MRNVRFLLFATLALAVLLADGASSGHALDSASGQSTRSGAPAQPSQNLTIGMLLPLTGGLSEFGMAMQNGGNLAALHVNNAGGVLGQPVVVIVADSQSDLTAALIAAQSLIDDGVDAIVGEVASGITLEVAGQVTIPSGMLLISPASTSPAITSLADDDLVFRTVNSDALQAPILAQVARDQGFQTACTMHINNAYGQGLSASFTEAFQALGGTVQVEVPHGEQSSYLGELQQCTSGTPDVLAGISYPQHGAVYLKEALDNMLIDQFVFSDGLKSQDMFDQLGADDFEGMYGTSSVSEHTAEFSGAYEAQYGEPPLLPYIAEAYDAVVSVALAAERAGSTDSATIRDSLRDVTCPPGPSIGAGAAPIGQAVQLVAAGQSVNFEGATGSLEFTEYGDDVRGAIEIWTIVSGQIVTDREESAAAQPDLDGDGFDACVEDYLGSDFLDACPDDLSDYAWPLDVSNDGQLSVVGDVLNFRDRIGATPGAPNWWQRLDFNADGQLSVVGDVLMYRDRIGETCT